MRYESNLLVDRNHCPDVCDLELDKTPFFWPAFLKLFESKFYTRMIVNAPDGNIASGMLIDKKSQEIIAIYTDPAYRLKKYAKGLVSVARTVYPRLSVIHMTEDGQKFFKTLNMAEE